jgi:uncharacterized membrane protein YphA (DoxX/SURF4 family)
VRDNWRLSGIAVLFVVVLRLAIGWQLVYEGLWKLNTFSTAKPWTSAGYLRNARGPLRGFYREMTGDPDDLHWLDYDQVAACLDAYRDAFVIQHPDLTESQKVRLSDMLDGPAQFSVPLGKLPDGIKFTPQLEKAIHYDADNKLLVVDGKQHLIPKEKAELERIAKSDKSAKPADVQPFLKALDDVYKKSAKLSYKERLVVLLKVDPERVGIVYRDDKTKEVVEERKGKITQYKEMLARHEDELPRAHQAFEHHHLDVQWGEIQKLRAELVNPVRSLESEFKQESRKLLAAEQLARGPVPEPWTEQQRIDHTTIWALLAIGGLLMVGLGTRVSAVAGAVLLLSFYLAIPPWPGVEDLMEAAGPEHTYIINKNLIEVIALLAIAAMPTGQWFGVDRLFAGLVPGKRRSASVPPKAVS